MKLIKKEIHKVMPVANPRDFWEYISATMAYGIGRNPMDPEKMKQ